MTRRSRLAVAAFSVTFLTGHAVAYQATRAALPPAADDGTSPAALRATADMDRIRAARDAYEARRFVDRAVRAELAGRDDDAEALYAKAVELNPAHVEASQGLRATRDRLGLLADRGPLIERAEKERNAKRQETLYRFNAAVRLAERARKTGEPKGFESARLQLDRARLIRAEDPSLFSEADADRLDARLREQDVALTAAIQARQDALRAAQQRDWARRIKEARIHDISLD